MYRTVLWSSDSLKWPRPQLTNSRDKYSACPLGLNLGHFINWTKLAHCKFGFDKYQIVILRNYVLFSLHPSAVSYKWIIKKFLCKSAECQRKQEITSLTEICLPNSMWRDENMIFPINKTSGWKFHIYFNQWKHMQILF
jgi:hypothetical protein